MLMADTMAIFFVILGMLLAFPGLWLLCRGLWGRTVNGAAEVCRRGLIKPFLIGLPVTALMVFAAAILGNLGTVGKISSVAAVCFYLMFANCGVSGLVTTIGERLMPASGAEDRWRATLRGGIVLELAFLLPILGWFVILPFSINIGCGANLIALLRSISASSRESLPGNSDAAGADDAGIKVTGAIGAER